MKKSAHRDSRNAASSSWRLASSSQAILFAALCASLGTAWAQSTTEPRATNASSPADSGGPVKLQGTGATRSADDSRPTDLVQCDVDRPRGGSASPEGMESSLSEFERYVQRAQGTQAAGTEPVKRLGSELMTPCSGIGSIQDLSTQIPPDYVVGVGDEVLVTLWGSVDADARLTVDRSGRIVLPRVGPILVAGVRYSDLNETISRRVAQVFKNFQVSASLGKLRSIRIYVTGYTKRPGAYTVSSLSTLVNAVMRSGGPTASGSLRQIELRRSGKLISTLDFYDLLLKGDRSGDRSLQADDVIHINAIGPQVAVIGSVNKPAIFELKGQERVDDVLAMAGGFTAVADRSRLTVEHLDRRNEERISELKLPQQGHEAPRNGDIIRSFSAVEAALPQHKQSKRILVEGEVQRPGEYVLPADSKLSDAIQAAGGLTPKAYVFGTDLQRESVRITQQQNYERALRDMETEFTRSTSTRKTASADDASAQAAQAQASSRLIERLRSVKPTGRIVLQLSPGTSNLPELAIENGDRLNIPAQPSTVGVFGSVFNAGSYLYTQGSAIPDVLKLAGGPTRGADTGSIFVVRANGSVVSVRQNSSGWLLGSGNMDGVRAEPGDTVFVPEQMDKTTFIQEAKDWTQILYQFGLGAAALKTIKN